MTSKIEWTDETWNPVTGCTPISEGCDHCYARRMANRLKGRYGYPDTDPFQVHFRPGLLNRPLKWKQPRRIFVCSMGDLFHDDVDNLAYDSISNIIDRCPQHTFMILTKRPKKMKAIFETVMNPHFNNLWLGVTAENQQRADERIPILLQIPAARRFVSIEPMLSNVKLRHEWLCDRGFCCDSGTISWCIVGGETGPGARKMEAEWAYSVRDQCISAGIPFFFKKWGSYYAAYFPDRIDGREWKEFPK